MANLDWLHAIRYGELQSFVHLIGKDDRVLEIGGGTGYQAQLLAERGVSIVSVDMAKSLYRNDRVRDIVEYDGHNLPFAGGTFDKVVSSHVLEHVVPLSRLQAEMARVLDDSGSAIHVVPTHLWLLLNWVVHYPHMASRLLQLVLRRLRPAVAGPLTERDTNAEGQGAARQDRLPEEEMSMSMSTMLMRRLPRPEPWQRPEDLPEQGVFRLLRILRSGIGPRRHGERGNVLTEPLYFRPAWWRRHFRQHGWTILAEFPVPVLNSGLFRTPLGLSARRTLSSVLGPSTWAFHVSPPKG